MRGIWISSGSGSSEQAVVMMFSPSILYETLDMYVIHAVENVPSKLQCGTCHCKDHPGIAVCVSTRQTAECTNFAIYLANI